MLDAARIRPAIARIGARIGACIGALALTTACTTPRMTPVVSQAVLDARAGRDVPPTGVCPDTALNTVSPVMVGFAFGESQPDESLTGALGEPARWLACHPNTQAVIKPDADTHGSDAEQDALARRRAEGVRNFLIAHGVAAERVRILSRNEAAPTGAIFLIRAEGRRW